MHGVQPKKSLGQHFLRDENIARKIISSIPEEEENIIEIGPGEGVLSKYILANDKWNSYCIDTDKEAVEFLWKKFPQASDRIILQNFLKTDIAGKFSEPICLVGNLITADFTLGGGKNTVSFTVNKYLMS